MGRSRATHYRAAGPQAVGRRHPDARTGALTDAEADVVIATLNSERFCDQAPAQVWATLLDEGTYLASISTMYRLLRERAQVRERRAQARRPALVKPELVATAPNEVWSWDITKLAGPYKWTWFQLYMILDVYSRYVVGWLVAPRESAILAEQLIADAIYRHEVAHGQLTLHADRGQLDDARRPSASCWPTSGCSRATPDPISPTTTPTRRPSSRRSSTRPRSRSASPASTQPAPSATGFFEHYNHEHRHSGIGLHTPADVHYGLADVIREKRQGVLDAAYAAHAEPLPHAHPRHPGSPRPPGSTDPRRRPSPSEPSEQPVSHSVDTYRARIELYTLLVHCLHGSDGPRDRPARPVPTVPGPPPTTPRPRRRRRSWPASWPPSSPSATRGRTRCRWVRLFTRVERCGVAGKTLTARRVGESNLHRRSGHRSAAEYLAAETGDSVGETKDLIRLGEQLGDQPELAGAFREGSVSRRRAAQVSDAVAVNPGKEAELVAGAKADTDAQLRERCQRAKAQGRTADEEARHYRRLHQNRRCFTGTDTDGAFVLRALLAPDAGARVRAALEAQAERVFEQARTAGAHEGGDAYRADALVALVTGRGVLGPRGEAGRSHPRPPGPAVHPGRPHRPAPRARGGRRALRDPRGGTGVGRDGRGPPGGGPHPPGGHRRGGRHHRLLAGPPHPEVGAGRPARTGLAVRGPGV